MGNTPSDQGQHGEPDWPNIAVLLVVFAACLGALSGVDYLPQSIEADDERPITSTVDRQPR